MQNAGFEATAIDVVTDTFEFARKYYGVSIQKRDILDTGFPDKAFDCTIMKEVVFHLDFAACLPEVERITRQRLIIFQGTTNLLLQLARGLLRHREHNRQPLGHYRDTLLARGWRIVTIEFSDPLALYLSGGVIGPVLVPSAPKLCSAVMAVDRAMNRIVNLCQLATFMCGRFLLVAEVPGAVA